MSISIIGIRGNEARSSSISRNTIIPLNKNISSVNEYIKQNFVSINGVKIYLEKYFSLHQVTKTINRHKSSTKVEAIVVYHNNQKKIIIISAKRIINIEDHSMLLFTLYKKGLIYGGKKLDTLMQPPKTYFGKSNPECIIKYTVSYNNSILSKSLSLVNSASIYFLASDESDRVEAIENFERMAMITRMQEMEEDGYSSDESDRVEAIENFERMAMITRMQEMEEDGYSSDESDRVEAIFSFQILSNK